MILQVATLTVRPGSEAAFERAVARAEPLFRDAAGYLSHELRRSVENAQRYALLVEWRRLEDRAGSLPLWAALRCPREGLQALLQCTPDIEHFAALPAAAPLGHLVD